MAGHRRRLLPRAGHPALTVDATGWTDTTASWSNYGSVLDLFVPGVNITSAWNTSNSATYTGSVTSFAAPHVASGAALPGRTPSATPATANAAIVSNSTTGALISGGKGSPNRLLYTAPLGS